MVQAPQTPDFLTEQTRKLGVDFGGVIVESTDRNSDTSFFSGNFLETPERPHAAEALRSLHDSDIFGGDIWIVSKCGEAVQEKTLQWLDYHDFYNRTGIDPGHVRFTRTREGKADIARELGLTDFVDDRLEVLRHVAPTVGRLILYNSKPAEVQKQSLSMGRRMSEVVLTDDWLYLESLLTRKAA